MSQGLVHILNEEIIRQRAGIKAIGLDLDGTLTDLQTDEVQNLIGDRTLKLLPDDLKKALDNISFEKLRKRVRVSVGWYLDLKTGYLLQPNSEGSIIKARSGRKELSDAVIAEEYCTKIELPLSLEMDKQKPRFLPVCDGFDYVEGVITAALAATHGLPRKRTLTEIAYAVRKVHDDAQKGFKSEMLRNPAKYGIGTNDRLIEFLDALKSRGYRIFLLTASKRRYASKLLGILGLSEKRYFDRILTRVTKPACFHVGTNDNTRLLKALRRTGISSTSEVLYIGDHLYKDVISARKLGFKTCLRMPRTHIDTVENKLSKYGGVTFRIDGRDHSLRIAYGQLSRKQALELGNHYYQLHQSAHILTPKLHYLKPILLH